MPKLTVRVTAEFEIEDTPVDLELLLANSERMLHNVRRAMMARHCELRQITHTRLPPIGKVV